MKAFLSHSSRDKGFVETVAEFLRPGTFEIDSQTFDSGLLNSDAIITALKRSELFCLFLSENSATSAYVEFETLLGMELFASGKITNFLVICLDDKSFNLATENVRYFNIVRKILEPESAARLIQGHLITASSLTDVRAHPFVGREEELSELESQIVDHTKPIVKGFFISGNFGSGRRTIAHKFYEDQYPKVGKIFPAIDVDEFAGLEELYRAVLSSLRPSLSHSELKTRSTAFSLATREEKTRQIAQLLNSLLASNEAALLMDKGGVLTDSGSLTTELNEVIGKIEGRPYPPIIIVTPRMIPIRARRKEDDLAYLAVRALKRPATNRLVSRLLRDASITPTEEQLNQLINLTDGHPFNIYRAVHEASDRGLSSFLANPTDFIDWKHRQSSDYLKKIQLSQNDIYILSLLKIIPELDFATLVVALEIDPHQTSEDLLRLTNLHILESVNDQFTLAPAVRIAVERDTRIKLPTERYNKAIKVVADSLTIRLEDGTAPISLLNAAILASLESGSGTPELTAAFILPSHYVSMAKRHYDSRNWNETIRFAKEALQGIGRLATNAIVAACRFLCLAAARIGNDELFQEGMRKLEALATDDWAKSNIAFLKGFNLRLKGYLPQAELQFRESYSFSVGNLSAAREIAAICLSRDNLEEAETFAREAYAHAPSNPYVLDILASVLIRKHGKSAKHAAEVRDVFDLLERVGEEGGRSFFTTRRAEYEHLWGDNREALRLIEEAVRKTPTIFEPRRLHAEILLKEGNKIKALEVINVMKEMVESRNPDDRRSNYRSYISTLSHYLISIEQYNDAKALYDDRSVFTEEEKLAAVKDIEITQGFRMNSRNR